MEAKSKARLRSRSVTATTSATRSRGQPVVEDEPTMSSSVQPTPPSNPPTAAPAAGRRVQRGSTDERSVRPHPPTSEPSSLNSSPAVGSQPAPGTTRRKSRKSEVTVDDGSTTVPIDPTQSTLSDSGLAPSSSAPFAEAVSDALSSSNLAISVDTPAFEAQPMPAEAATSRRRRGSQRRQSLAAPGTGSVLSQPMAPDVAQFIELLAESSVSSPDAPLADLLGAMFPDGIGGSSSTTASTKPWPPSVTSTPMSGSAGSSLPPRLRAPAASSGSGASNQGSASSPRSAHGFIAQQPSRRSSEQERLAASGHGSSDGQSDSAAFLRGNPDATTTGAGAAPRVASAGDSDPQATGGRDDDDGGEVLNPLVPCLAARCVVGAASVYGAGIGADDALRQGTLSFTPWQGFCSVLFIDMSGYSRITSKLASHGAQEVSSCVNAYLERILDIVSTYGGDVVKFAGDAIIAVWHYDDDASTVAAADAVPSTASNIPGSARLGEAVAAAAACAVELQASCGEHMVSLVDDKFLLHIALASGVVLSDVLQPGKAGTTQMGMQRAFHYVTGDALTDAGNGVELARSGEISISAEAIVQAKGVVDLEVTDLSPSVADDPSARDALGECRFKLLVRASSIGQPQSKYRLKRLPPRPPRPPTFDGQFVHPYISQRLLYGFRPLHMPEMRILAVMFIRAADDQAQGVADWFSEVFEELERWRCPILQVIDDDKGFHVVAAAGLFESEASPAAQAVACARALLDRQISFTAGLAVGSVFCGFVGSEVCAMRWDITGDTVVRACRVMQAALDQQLPMLADASIREGTTDPLELQPAGSLTVKGSPNPVTVFSLADAGNSVMGSVVLGAHLKLSDKVHAAVVEQLVNHVRKKAGAKRRPIALASGPRGTGKFCVVQLVAHACNAVPIVHEPQPNSKQLSVAGTIVQWYSYHRLPVLRDLAKRASDALARSHLSMAMTLTCSLVNTAEAHGETACLIIRHAHTLDNMSVSLLKEIHGRPVATAAAGTSCQPGLWVSLLTHFPMYGCPSAARLVQVLSDAAHRRAKAHRDKEKCSLTIVNTPLYVEVGFVDKQAFGAARAKITGIHYMRESTSDVMVRLSYGHISLGMATGFFMSKLWFRLRRVAEASGQPMQESSRMDERGGGGFLQLGVDALTDASWAEIAPIALSPLTVVYDVLPPQLQIVLKVIAGMAAQNSHLRCPISVVAAVVRQMVSRKNAKAVESNISELCRLKILDTEGFDANATTKASATTGSPVTTEPSSAVFNPGSASFSEPSATVWFLNPALCDFVVRMLTPQQLRSINARCARLLVDFVKIDSRPLLQRAHDKLILARFHHVAGDTERHEELIHSGWNDLSNYLTSLAPSQRIFASDARMIEDDFARECRRRGISAYGDNGEGPRRLDEVILSSVPPAVPNHLVDVKNHQSTLRLGPIAGLIGTIATLLLMRFYEAVRRESIVDPALYETVCANLDRLEDAIELCHKLYGGRRSEPQEESDAAEAATLVQFLREVVEPCQKKAVVSERAMAFRKLYEEGGQLAVYAARWSKPSCLARLANGVAEKLQNGVLTVNRSTTASVSARDAALDAVEVVLAEQRPRSTTSFDAADDDVFTVSSHAFNSAFMRLATSNWRSVWPKLSVVRLREDVQRMGVTGYGEVLAFLCLCVLLPLDV